MKLLSGLMLATLIFVANILMLTVVVFGAAAQVVNGQAMKKKKVILGQPAISFYRISGEIIRQTLEKQGYEVELKEGTHDVVFPLLSKGEVDIFNAVWLPEGHKFYYEQYKDRITEIGVLYEKAGFFLGVSTEATDLNSIEDLKKESVQKRVLKTFHGIGAGAGISMMTKVALEKYGLSDFGYQFQAGTPASSVAAYETALKERKWAVIPLWKPHFLNKQYQIKPLADPQNVFSSSERVVLVARRGIEDKLDSETLDKLRSLKLSVEIVTELDFEVNVNQKSVEEAVKEWIERNHPEEK